MPANRSVPRFTRIVPYVMFVRPLKVWTKSSCPASTVTERFTFWPALWIAPNFASHQADAVPPVSVSVAAE